MLRLDWLVRSHRRVSVGACRNPVWVVTHKVLQSSFFWPILFRDVARYVKSYDQCQRKRSISRRHEMPLHNILEVEICNFGDQVHGAIPTMEISI